jgi:hypothetical protein
LPLVVLHLAVEVPEVVTRDPLLERNGVAHGYPVLETLAKIVAADRN